jgi:hypothetical protein
MSASSGTTNLWHKQYLLEWKVPTTSAWKPHVVSARSRSASTQKLLAVSSRSRITPCLELYYELPGTSSVIYLNAKCM